MKKKNRDIVVNHVTYSWLVHEKNFPNNILRIWNSTDKNVLFCELTFNGITEFMSVTPSLVENVITEINFLTKRERRVFRVPLKNIISDW